MRNRKYMRALMILIISGTTMSLNAQEKPKKDSGGILNKRIVIIKKGSDSTESTRDTIEIKMTDIENIEEISVDTNIHEQMHKIPAIVSSANINLGFTNAYIPEINTAPGSPYAMIPEFNNGKSIHVGFENNWGFNLIRGNLRLFMGLRYDINSYRFSNSDTRLTGNTAAFTSYQDSLNNSVKSKVVVNYLGVPIALGYQCNKKDPNEGFYVRAGVNAGYRVRTHSKVKLENGNKDKNFDDFSFNDFALTPFVQIGYNSVGLYARYTTTPLFKSGQGQEAYAFQFGLLIQ